MRKKLLFIIVLFLWGIGVFAKSNVRIDPDSIPFAPAVNYEVGQSPTSVFCADLDGDSDLDLAVTNYSVHSNSVSILMNKGDGTFQDTVNYYAGREPLSVFSTDLDGDSDFDLIVANGLVDSGYISVLKNNGDGTFQSAVSYDVGIGTYSIFCVDLNGDSHPDLAVANSGSNNVSILINNGNGTFRPAVNYGAGNAPISIFCADVDGDSNQDLAVANLEGNNVSILKNNGNGTFQPAIHYTVGTYPRSVFCADINRDGPLDLVVANGGDGSVSVLLNLGNGTFSPPVNYRAGDYPISVFCTDLDNDANLDIAVVNHYSNNVSILKNNGDGAFLSAINYQAGNHPFSVFCADLDGDSDIDLAIANEWDDNVSILLSLNSTRPGSYSLSLPSNADSVNMPVIFKWRKAIDPDPNDTILYDLYCSRSILFNPSLTIVYDSLVDTTYADSLGVGPWYWKVKAYDQWGVVRWSDQSWSFYIYLSGDVNADIKVTVSDVVYLINFLFKGGPAPKPYRAGEVNCDGYVTVVDVVYLINYLFKGGPSPCS